jgi:hypothetical protein
MRRKITIGRSEAGIISVTRRTKKNGPNGMCWRDPMLIVERRDMTDIIRKAVKKTMPKFAPKSRIARVEYCGYFFENALFAQYR